MPNVYRFPWKPKEDAGSPGAEITCGCEPYNECWELNSHLLPKQQAPQTLVISAVLLYFLKIIIILKECFFNPES